MAEALGDVREHREEDDIIMSRNKITKQVVWVVAEARGHAGLFGINPWLEGQQ